MSNLPVRSITVSRTVMIEDPFGKSWNRCERIRATFQNVEVEEPHYFLSQTLSIAFADLAYLACLRGRFTSLGVNLT